MINPSLFIFVNHNVHIVFITLSIPAGLENLPKYQLQ